MDTFNVRYVDRYAEQLWDTLFAKAPEIMLFNWAAMTRSVVPGNRTNWQNLHTSFDNDRMLQAYKSNAPSGPPEPSMARVAGYSLEQVDAFLDKLGKPIGIQSYKPFQSSGEDFSTISLGISAFRLIFIRNFPPTRTLSC